MGKHKRKFIFAIVAFIMIVILSQTPPVKTNYYAMRGLLVQGKNPKQALKYYKRANDLREDVKTRYNIANIYYNLGYFSEFKAEILDALYKYPNEEILIDLLAKATPSKPELSLEPGVYEGLQKLEIIAEDPIYYIIDDETYEYSGPIELNEHKIYIIAVWTSNDIGLSSDKVVAEYDIQLQSKAPYSLPDPSVDTPDKVSKSSTKSAFGVLVDQFYQDAGYFKDGVCPIKMNDKWGLIDEEGNCIVKPQWDYMSLCSTDGYLLVANDLGVMVETYDDPLPLVECGFIDIEGNIVVPMKKSVMDPAPTEYVIMADYLGNDRFSIQVYNEDPSISDFETCLYFDNNGREIPEVTDEYVPQVEYFTTRIDTNNGYLYGIEDADGNTILEAQYDMVFSIGGGFFLANEGGSVAMQYLCDGNWKIINKEGSLVLDLEDYNDFYFDFNVVHYGMGESFTIYTPAGALIVGRVDTNGQEAQDLLKKYWNMKEVVFKEITASSTLPAANSVTYFPENVADGDIHTAWVEGVLGNGENEWLMFSTDQPIKLSSLLIKNGYTKNRDLYLKNNRIKTMKLEFSDGTTQTLNIPDDYYELFYYTLPEEVYTSYVKCTIESVYKGTKYQDTCLSEMKFFTLD